jgi:hypothetical protein
LGALEENEAEYGKIEVEECQKLIEVCLEDLRQRYKPMEGIQSTKIHNGI